MRRKRETSRCDSGAAGKRRAEKLGISGPRIIDSASWLYLVTTSSTLEHRYPSPPVVVLAWL